MNPKLHDDLQRLHAEDETRQREGRRRLMAAIADQPPHPAHVGFATRHATRRLGGLAAAAAILFMIYVTLFSNGTQQTAWAAVLDQLNRIESLAWRQKSIVSADGYADDAGADGSWDRGYLKAPHLLRLEQGIASTSQPAGDARLPIDVRIWRTEPGREVHIDLCPREKRAVRRIISTNREPSRLRNVPGEVWEKLQKLREQDVRALENRLIDGVQTLGFEAPLADFEPNAPDLGGTIRVWVHEQTAVPVRIELRCPIGDDYSTTFLTAIEWNVDLPDKLFEVPDDSDWTVEEHDIHDKVFAAPGAQLRPGVTLEVTTAGGDIILSRQHVARVTASRTERSGTEQTSLFVDLTPEGKRRLAEYTAAHIGETVTITLNGQVIGRPQIRAPLSGGFQIDIPSDGPAVEELIEPTVAPDADGD